MSLLKAAINGALMFSAVGIANAADLDSISIKVSSSSAYGPQNYRNLSCSGVDFCSVSVNPSLYSELTGTVSSGSGTGRVSFDYYSYRNSSYHTCRYTLSFSYSDGKIIDSGMSISAIRTAGSSRCRVVANPDVNNGKLYTTVSFTGPYR
ncbi:hypothetical protein PsAD46_04339 [Pseudovibrio sp. Ad46]|uniref:hypothetical protein n=1 Tax=unclassified Pseudovibrio TaxID=2627060 RepID=UPI0007B2E7EA|nr:MULTISPECIES: hypothetical protein [unclassified Pseudovibrio]KZK79627.1 hypothetical protein PsAD46_04339 [Pseudovibrio sp. Ad46]KZL19214.1 hypothetical protein PsAD37_03708 [Pseudovibrio sp. Ad37]KZL23329.1 hypothetical protein PsWM33_03518 [Pseudovibrio sp. WM33]